MVRNPFKTVSGKLSARRRSRFAAPALLLAALLGTGGIYAVLSPADASSSTSSTDDVAEGKALFLVGCSSCHGMNGEGITTKKGDQLGPSLAGVGAAAVDFQVSTGRMPMAAPGPQAPVKPRVYTDDETKKLAAFVASLGPGPEIPAKEDYDPAYGEDGQKASAKDRKESVVRGGELFRTNCTACHNFAGEGGALPGGKYAPKLIGVSDKHIFEALVTGPQQMPVFDNSVLTPQDKRDIISYLKKNEDTPGYGGFSMGAVGPVSEGMFAWLVGIGGLVGFAVWIAAHTARAKKGQAQ